VVAVYVTKRTKHANMALFPAPLWKWTKIISQGCELVPTFQKIAKINIHQINQEWDDYHYF
jgi:hypothetical protein